MIEARLRELQRRIDTHDERVCNSSYSGSTQELEDIRELKEDGRLLIQAIESAKLDAKLLTIEWDKKEFTFHIPKLNEARLNCTLYFSPEVKT